MVQYLNNNSGFAQWSANQNAQTKKPSRFGSFLWYLALFFVAWWVVSLFMTPKTETVVTTEQTPSVDVSSVPVTEIKSDSVTARVQGLRINDVLLHGFAADASGDAGSERVKLLSHENELIEVGLRGTDTIAPSATTVWNAENDAFVWRNADGVVFNRKINTDGYLITITDEVQNATGRELSFVPYAMITRDAADKTSSGVKTGAVAFVNNDTEYLDWRKMDKKSYAYSTVRGFAGFADQYWETLVGIERPDQTIRTRRNGEVYQTDIESGAVTIAPGATGVVTTKIFAGPRDQKTLNALAETMAGIDETVDYGWFWFLARPMLWALNGLDSFVGNYGLAIILFTLIVRILMWPLTRKSYASTMAMQKMQPEMARIQKLYANDKARMQMEMMRLYRTHKTSPMSGCLPMLIQIPIFFALYKALLVSVPMRGAHFLWISDLAAMDPYFILPILMGATMWFQQRLQSAAQAGNPKSDVANQTMRMMKWMPLIFTVMFAWMPAGLVLYWTVSNVFGIGQMYVIKKQVTK